MNDKFLRLDAFFVQVPPPENGHAQEYGKPLKMAHAIVTDPCLSVEVLQQIEQCIMFYKGITFSKKSIL